MDPVIDNEWLGIKNEPLEEGQNVGNVARSWQWRELGLNPPHSPPNKTVLENMAEDLLVQKSLNIKSCDLPGYPRSTFLMVFSPDGTKVASTHGNHNVYVSELASGKHVRILKGHPRTPWCIAFHPSHPQLIGSGCLGGQVRVWDISSGGSEVWNVLSAHVIASIAFHPREQLLVIATQNELYFWDWSQPAPFTKVCTNNINEKVRYVAFDALGFKLITGISLWPSAGGTAAGTLLQRIPTATTPRTQSNNRRDDSGDSTGQSGFRDTSNSAQDLIVNSYQNLVQRYDSLVRNYQRLFMVRHRLTNTPSPPSTIDLTEQDLIINSYQRLVQRYDGLVRNYQRLMMRHGITSSPLPTPMIDRGTDPMEQPPSTLSSSSNIRSSASTGSFVDANPTPGTSRQPNASDSGGSESNNSPTHSTRLDPSLDNSSRSQNPTRASLFDHALFGSRSSAFQRLIDHRTMNRPHRPADQNEHTTVLLPNPFSPTCETLQSNRNPSGNAPQQCASTLSNTSRTSIFTSSRSMSPIERSIAQRLRHCSLRPAARRPAHSERTPASAENTSSPTAQAPDGEPSTSAANTTQRPTMTNSSTQISPDSPDRSMDAQAITDSLNLIRDILRDSGTRLLNLITNMSLSTLASVERSMPRGPADASPSARIHPQVRLLTRSLRQDFLSSNSDSDSDSLEVNIFRTRNTTFREDDSRDSDRTPTPSPSEGAQQPTDRLVFELNDDIQDESAISRETGGINVSSSNSRFRVRTQSGPSEVEVDARRRRGEESESFGASTRNGEGTSEERRPSADFDADRPSTSRDNFSTGEGTLPPDEAYRRVRGGVSALQKHTMLLTNLWLRGNRTTMRELRNMWENLRRRIVSLQRQTSRQDMPSYYTRSLLERCMILTEMNDSIRNSTRAPRSSQKTEANRNSDESRNLPVETNSIASEINPENVPSTLASTASSTRQTQIGRTPPTRSFNIRSSSSTKRRLQPSHRWRAEDELRRRSRNLAATRASQRYASIRSRRDFARALELSVTRHEIRMRAMQVLSVMFNMMMMCLDERGLSPLIITMLRTLKKALALSCLMLMTNRNNGRSGTNPAPTSQQRIDSLNVIRIQNVDHAGPINVDGLDEPPSPNILYSTSSDGENEERLINQLSESNRQHYDAPRTTTSSQTRATQSNNVQQESQQPTTNSIVQRWSNRLAVQIAAANRNNSSTARFRRELYLESKRLKALHRTNPTAHPLIKKRALPPVFTYRIPVLRSFLGRQGTQRSPKTESNNNEPVAGPSNSTAESHEQARIEVMNDFEQRLNSLRIARMQAVRLRNSARNRFRRLQTIRLYTPSSVREMFNLPANNTESQSGNGSAPVQNGPDVSGLRPFAGYYRSHIITPLTGNRPSEEPGRLHAVLNNVVLPLMQVNDLHVEAQGPLPQRISRIHEYLQPIILAQNAMLDDVEGGDAGGISGGGGVSAGGGGGGSPGGGGAAAPPDPRRIHGMAGLLEAGIISEALPAPSHRVQAWDFTTGATPDIADSTKNVVVQRCRIHNDASIDISKDGRLLVALLPVPRLRTTNHWLGVYSLEWSRLGQCLHTAVLEQSAVSVALSPTARHLAVGLGSRRFTTLPHRNVFALLYRLDPLENSSRTGLSPIKELEQNWEHSFTSLNCLRWAPQPGQGLVYANNTGQLIIMS